MSTMHYGGQDDIERWLRMELTRIEPSIDAASVNLRRTWHSRTAALHQFACNHSRLGDVVVKVHAHHDQAVAHFESMSQVAAASEYSAITSFAPMRPLGLAKELCAVAMPFFEGDNLIALIRTGKWRSPTFREDLASIIGTCGAFLASYHRTCSSQSEIAVENALSRMEARISRALDFRVSIDTTQGSGFVARSYGDFHPGHVIVTADRKVALIDPPLALDYEYNYRDIALFEYQLYAQLHHPSALSRHPTRMRYFKFLRDAFRDGYVAAVGRGFSMYDESLIAGYGAYFIKRKLRARRILTNVTKGYLSIPLTYRLFDVRREARLKGIQSDV